MMPLISGTLHVLYALLVMSVEYGMPDVFDDSGEEGLSCQ